MHPATDIAAEIPAFDVRALARRAALPGAIAAAIVVALVVTGGPLQAFGDALGRVVDADPRWIAAAVVFELLSFGGYVALLRLVGGRAAPRLGVRASAQVTLGGAAATRVLPTAGLGGVALTHWALRRAGLDGRDATRTLLAFLVVLYAVFLAAIATAGTLLALGVVDGNGPLALSAVPAIAAVLAIAIALAAAAHSTGGVLGAAVRDALALVRSGDPRLLGAPAWWAFDVAVLYTMLAAFGTAPSLAVVVLGYFVGQVANTVPVPGAASGGMVGVLLAFGVEADLALAAVLGYRAVAVWLPAPLGLAAIAGLRRTTAHWSREDAAPVSRAAAAVVSAGRPASRARSARSAPVPA